jgi:hypothetical protein
LYDTLVLISAVMSSARRCAHSSCLASTTTTSSITHSPTAPSYQCPCSLPIIVSNSATSQSRSLLHQALDWSVSRILARAQAQAQTQQHTTTVTITDTDMPTQSQTQLIDNDHEQGAGLHTDSGPRIIDVAFGKRHVSSHNLNTARVQIIRQLTPEQRKAERREERRQMLAGVLSGVTVAGISNPYDRALYLSIKHHRRFLSKTNWIQPYKGFLSGIVIRTISA